MTTDENGKKWPETVEEAAQLAQERARVDKFFANKAKREGWAQPIHNQGSKPKSEQTSAERLRRRKSARAGTNNVKIQDSMKELPNTIHREKIAEREQRKYNGRQDSLQEAVVGLSDLMNVRFESTEQLESVSIEWLDEEINKSKSNLRTIFGTNGGFIPAGISQQFAENYESIRKKARPFIDGIQNGLAFSKAEQIPLKFDSKGRPWLDEKVVREKVKEAALYSFSDEEKEFYKLIAPIFDTLDEVRKFEKQHGLLSSDLKHLFSEYIESADLQRAKYALTPEKYYSLTSYGKVLTRLHPIVNEAKEEEGDEQ